MLSGTPALTPSRHQWPSCGTASGRRSGDWTSSIEAAPRQVLEAASHRAGLDRSSAELIQFGENAAAKVASSPASPALANLPLQREVAVAKWLEANDVAADQAWPGVDQAVGSAGARSRGGGNCRPIGTGQCCRWRPRCRRLRELPRPTEFDTGRLDLFVRLADRIDRAASLDEAGRAWMRGHLVEVQARYAEFPEGLPQSVVHGDAWIGNVVSTGDGEVVLLDLERYSIGPPE